jgi:hypothetical protein
MQYAYIYNPIPEITILGHSDPKMHITIEFALKLDAICMYICPDSRNYHIRLLQSQNRYLSSLTMELLSDQPVSLQWVQYRSGQSMYNGYDK